MNWTIEDAERWIAADMEEGVCQDDCEYCHSMEIALAAVRKQMAVEVTHKLDGHHCPVCDKGVYYPAKYCILCGQKLRW